MRALVVLTGTYPYILEHGITPVRIALDASRQVMNPTRPKLKLKMELRARLATRANVLSSIFYILSFPLRDHHRRRR